MSDITRAGCLSFHGLVSSKKDPEVSYLVSSYHTNYCLCLQFSYFSISLFVPLMISFFLHLRYVIFVSYSGCGVCLNSVMRSF